MARVHPLGGSADADVRELAADVAAGAGSPWGNASPGVGSGAGWSGTFDGRSAAASISGIQYTLRPPRRSDRLPRDSVALAPGEYPLLLLCDDGPLGIVVLRLRLASGATELSAACLRHDVGFCVPPGRDPVAAKPGRRSRPVTSGLDLPIAIRRSPGRSISWFQTSARCRRPWMPACDVRPRCATPSPFPFWGTPRERCGAFVAARICGVRRTSPTVPPPWHFWRGGPGFRGVNGGDRSALTSPIRTPSGGGGELR